MSKLQVIILSNEIKDDCNLWIDACKNFKERIDYRVVNLTSYNWLEEIQSSHFDILLAKPGGLTSRFKQLYDERVYILERTLGYKIYPSAGEVFIYENKRFLSYWLKSNQIPHPCTNVFYYKKEAETFLEGYIYPLVGKTNIGASGSGIRILKNKSEAIKYLNKTFSGKGAPRRIGPNLRSGNLIKRGLKYISNFNSIIAKLGIYRSTISDFQNGFVIFQEYIPHDFEWRVVRIGDSFFAHKKIKKGEMASGSLLKNYDIPPHTILNFVKTITDKYNFFSQAVDVFEHDGDYLVNEMQCIFGQSDPYQMLIDNIPGRYLFINDKWVFEEGDFNTNESYNLRISFILNSFEHYL